MTDLVGRTTRGIRDLMTDSTVGAINTAFQDEGFAPDPDCRYENSSMRRQTTQSYLDAVDWTDPRHVGRFLRVAERLLNGWEPQGLNQFHQSLRRDGYQVDEQTARGATLDRIHREARGPVSHPRGLRAHQACDQRRSGARGRQPRNWSKALPKLSSANVASRSTTSPTYPN